MAILAIGGIAREQFSLRGSVFSAMYDVARRHSIL